MGLANAIRAGRNSRYVEASETPAEFDWRKEIKGVVHAIRDQGDCGACWAFGTSESFSDRLAIVTNNKTNVVLSPQYMVSCWNGRKEIAGCEGATTLDVY